MKKLINYIKYKFSGFLRPKKVPNNMNDGEGVDFEIPEVPKTYVASSDVILYSHYLKDLGLSQRLDYGDWYVTEGEGGYLVCKVHHKSDVDSYEDYEMMSAGKHTRLISQDEALNLLRVIGYDFNPMEQLSVDPLTGMVKLNLVNPLWGLDISILSENCHSAYVKAAAFALMMSKSVSKFHFKLKKDRKKPDES